ncbi:MAG: flagellar hook-basal body complex protein FliE [Alphaproteobacteria bacterium]|nr:flagellar hook-basal body complex protein FliE [Alphaproteobacteria bacterium]
MTITGANSLSEMRSAILSQNAALMRAAGQQAPAVSVGGSAAPTDFGKTISAALQSVNTQQVNAEQITDAYQRGATNDIVQVMVDQQKASLSFEATLQVRNKLLSTYRDIMNMPV